LSTPDPSSQDHSSEDQNFLNLFMVVIGALIGVTVFLIFLSRTIADNSQLVWVKQDPTYAAAVDLRIRPAAQVALSGEAPAAGALAVVAPEAAAPVAAKLTGEQVYNSACFACHGAGVGGAPKFGDAAAWTSRRAQGTATLNQHALQGFQGQTGFMPPKGGRVDLSDEEIISAVAFMSGS
jgi:cytochrome c5